MSRMLLGVVMAFLALTALLAQTPTVAFAVTETIDWGSLTQEQYENLTPEQLEEFRRYKKADPAVVSYQIWEDSCDEWHDAADHAQRDEFGYRLTASVPEKYTWAWWELRPYWLVVEPEDTLVYIEGTAAVTLLHKDGTSEDVSTAFTFDFSDGRIMAGAEDLLAAVPNIKSSDELRLSYRMRFADDCHRGLARGNESFGHVEYSEWSSRAEDRDAVSAESATAAGGVGAESATPVAPSSVGLAASPEMRVVAYTYDLDILKLGEPDLGTLEGAQFVLRDTKADVWYASGEPWSGDRADATVRTTGADGHTLFTCVDSDDYELVEIKAPDGYEALDAIDVSIACSPSVDGGALSASSRAATVKSVESATGLVALQIVDAPEEGSAAGKQITSSRPETPATKPTSLLRIPTTADITSWIVPASALIGSVFLIVVAVRRRRQECG